MGSKVDIIGTRNVKVVKKYYIYSSTRNYIAGNHRSLFVATAVISNLI